MHTHYSRSSKWQSSWLSLPTCKQANAHKQKDCTRTQRATDTERERECPWVFTLAASCQAISFGEGRAFTPWGGGGGHQEVAYFEFHSHLWKRKVQRPWKFSTLKLIWPMSYSIFSFLQTKNMEKIKIFWTVHLLPVFWEKIHQIFKNEENWKIFITFLLGIWVL
jgi:hypothetical protein